MAEILRTALFGKLNRVTYASIEKATVVCKVRGNPYVELSHWLEQLVELGNSDIDLICRRFGVDVSRLRSDINLAIERLPSGSTSIVDFSPHILDAVDKAWTYSTLMFSRPVISSGTLLVALLKTTFLSKVMQDISWEFQKVRIDTLTDAYLEITAESIERDLAAYDGTAWPRAAPRLQRQIFISYRRRDSVHPTGRLYDRIASAFGAEQVFKDVNSIPIGTRDFADEIRYQLQTAKVMLAVIGQSWLSVSDAVGRRRIDSENDLVRLELRWGLEHEDVSVIPVLLDDREMPDAASLPDDLRTLPKCQAARLRADPDFDSDVTKIIEAIRHILTAVSQR